MNNKSSILTVTSIVGLVTGASIALSDNSDNLVGKCYGVNECRGRTACANAEGSCAGTNSCKGQGWIPLSKIECAKQKGRFQPLEK